MLSQSRLKTFRSLLKNSDLAADILGKDFSLYEHFPDEVKNDEKIVKLYLLAKKVRYDISQQRELIEQTQKSHPKLFENRSFALFLVSHFGIALEYLSEDFKRNKEFVKYAIMKENIESISTRELRKANSPFSYAHADLKKDADFILDLLSEAEKINDQNVREKIILSIEWTKVDKSGQKWTEVDDYGRKWTWQMNYVLSTTVHYSPFLFIK